MPASKKSKFFRVATEGATTDGRKIERRWLEEIAETYNRAKYGARVFVEHIRGIHPDWGFRAMGDVTAVKTEEEDGKLVLYAQVDPTDEMVKMVGDRQKIYSSIEVAENFGGSGKAYLMGLGITDSPASLGTEILAFAASNPAANPFNARKQHQDNLISAAEESAIEFEDVEPAGPSLLDRVKGMFSRQGAAADKQFAEVHAAVEEIAEHVSGQSASTAEQFRELTHEFSAAKAELATVKAGLEELRTTINHTAEHGQDRPLATGAPAGAVATDC